MLRGGCPGSCAGSRPDRGLRKGPGFVSFARVIALVSLGSSSAMTVLSLPTMSTRLMSAKSSTMRGRNSGRSHPSPGLITTSGLIFTPHNFRSAWNADCQSRRQPPRSTATKLIGCARISTRQQSTDSSNRSTSLPPAPDATTSTFISICTLVTAAPALGRHARASIARWPLDASDSLVITTLPESRPRLSSVCSRTCCVRADGGAASS